METSSVEAKYQELLFLSPENANSKLQFILLIHAINLTEGLQCTGLAENDPESDYILPPGWEKDSDGVYSFRYYDPKAKDTVYLKFVTDGDNVDVNAVTASKNDKIFSLEFNIAEYKQYDKETIGKILKKYKSDLLVKMLPHLKPSEEAKQETEQRRVVPPEDDRGLFWTMPRNDVRDTNAFGDYGKSDLFPGPSHPIGIHSGGNLLGPRNPLFTGQPDPNYGPKIRYDPTGPGGIDPTNPDPDINFSFPGPFQKKDPRGGPFGGGPFGPGGFGGGFGGGGFGGGGLI